MKSGRYTIYRIPKDEAFYAAIDTYLVKATWRPMMRWRNNTDAAQSYEHSYTTELKVTEGREVTNSVSIAPSFEGLSLWGVSHSVKTFSSTETTTAETKEITVNVPPRSRVAFYQRVYTFRSSMFFINDAWNEEWNAGSPGGYVITRKECTVEIMSNDYLTTDTTLQGTGFVTVRTVSRADHESARTTRKRENLTKRAKNELSKMGL